MTPNDDASASALAGKSAGVPRPGRRVSFQFGLGSVALLAAFGRPLYHLVQYALHSDLYSHILLVPMISLYLAWLKRPDLPPPTAPSRRLALGFLVAGSGLLAIGWGAGSAGESLAEVDSLALTTISFLLFFCALCSGLWGPRTLQVLAFPLCFLVFMAPFPLALTGMIETFFQHTSATVAFAFFKLAGTTVYYRDLLLKLPGIDLEVAPECSGIHSSLALFITSLLAGHLFLRTAWKRTVLTLAVIPLAILRNGVRIFTIGELCVQVSPDMINSYIHLKGGPIFFGLALIPFFLLLLYLIKSERPARPAAPNPLPTC